MKKQGFTLVELLGVIVILGIIAVIATPPILARLKKTQNSVDEGIVKIIYSAGKSYISDEVDEDTLVSGKSFCYTVDFLVNSGYINEKTIENLDLENGTSILYTVDSTLKLSYDLKLYANGCSSGGGTTPTPKPAPTYLAEVTSATSTTSFWGGSITRNKVESINFTTSNTIPTGVLGSWDAGLNKNGSVMAWYTDTDSNGMYEVVVGSDGGVDAPSNSANLFMQFQELKSLDLTNLDTSDVTNMNLMFYYTGYKSNVFTLDLGNNFDTSNVTNMNAIFYYTGSANTKFILDIRGLDFSKVSISGNAFYTSGISHKLYTDNGNKSFVTGKGFSGTIINCSTSSCP